MAASNEKTFEKFPKTKPPIKDFRSPSTALNTIEYKLSNEEYVQLGWTKKPKARSTIKIILYETEISKPHLRWHKGFPRRFYPDGGLFFLNEDRGGKVYYPNGNIAIKIEKPEDRNYDLYTIFSPGGRDSPGVPEDPHMIGHFDTLGNGLVLSEDGEMRLSYNQIGGIYMDNPGALLPLVWAWNRRKNAPIMGSTYTEAAPARLLKILETSGQPQKRFHLGFNVNYKNPISSSLKDTSSDPHLHLKSRVHDAWNSCEPSASLLQILQEYRSIREMAGKRRRLLENPKPTRQKDRD